MVYRLISKKIKEDPIPGINPCKSEGVKAYKIAMGIEDKIYVSSNTHLRP